MAMSLIERAARAIAVELARQDGHELRSDAVHFERDLTYGYIDQECVEMGALVRAVLSAVRDPSDAMLAVGTREVWEAMIDAALAQ